MIVSVRGSKSIEPAKAVATTSSGLPMNASVLRLASLRPGKLRLNDVTIVFCSSPSTSSRFHWPMHGPQAFASTVAPARSKAAS